MPSMIFIFSVNGCISLLRPACIVLCRNVLALFQMVPAVSIQLQWSRLCWSQLVDCQTSTCLNKGKGSWTWCVHSRHCGRTVQLSHYIQATLIWLSVHTCGHTVRSLSTMAACLPLLM